MAKTELLLLPGLLCDATLWRHQTETLADVANIRVADLTGASSIAEMARQVLADAPDSFALAGLSMGGYVAQEILRQAPDRVERLALMDTSPRADTDDQSRSRRLLMAMAKEGKFKGVTPKLLPKLVHPDRLDDEPLVEAVTGMAERVGREAFLRQQTAIMNRPDGLRDLSAITCPTLVLCGREDALTPLAVHQEMAAGLPNAALVVIENCGHLSSLERPEAVSACLRYWLQVRPKA